jgi:putative oxidoreductase
MQRGSAWRKLMKTVRIVSAVLLAIPLLVFGGNYFVHLFPMPPGDGSAGDQLLQAMRAGGLMTAIAFSHVVVGVLLLVPRARFLGGLLQLPMSFGIVSFHATMMPAGLVTALPLLLLNLGVIADRSRLRALVGTRAAIEPTDPPAPAGREWL